MAETDVDKAWAEYRGPKMEESEEAFRAAWQARGSDLKEACDLLGQMPRRYDYAPEIALCPDGSGAVENANVTPHIVRWKSLDEMLPAMRAALPKPPTAKETLAAWCRIGADGPEPQEADCQLLDRFLKAAVKKEERDD